VHERFAAAVAQFDAVHRSDPRGDIHGVPAPYALHYHRRLANWIDQLAPDANESLRLAAHCQHLRRWALARSDFPEGRAGYKRWRKELAKKHASEAGAILEEVGYDQTTIDRVGELLLKKGLGSDDDTQLLEDAVCLVFVENELAAFAQKYDEEKLIRVLLKTKRKMSDNAQQRLLAMLPDLTAELQELLERALASELG
jgi:hypothetical protein